MVQIVHFYCNQTCLEDSCDRDTGKCEGKGIMMNQKNIYVKIMQHMENIEI